MRPWFEMIQQMFASRFTARVDDKDAAIAAFEAHNDKVRRGAPPERLLEWHPGDGWEPICAALDLPVPDEPFPHRNSTEEFLSRRPRPAE
jgi:hypothetical protein